MVSFVDALVERYADVRNTECTSNCELFIIGSLSPGKSGNNLILPPALSLNRCDIVSAGSQRKIGEFCRNVEELDLASNGLESLDEVLKIVSAMPNLRFLNLSQNDFSQLDVDGDVHHGHSGVSRSLRFDEPADDTSTRPSKRPFHELKALVLNNTHIPWPAIGHLLDLMSNLSDLHLSLNNYSSMAINVDNVNCPKVYANIRRLYISGNPSLCDWSEVARLVAAFPALEALTMADCNINVLPEDLNSCLPHVQSLNISNWPITSWEYLERLNQLPHLVELRCQGLKCLKALSDQDARRHHLIARLPSVQILNGSEVTADERIFAETQFVRWHLVNDHVLPRPQKFHELHGVYGRVDPLAEVNLAPPKCAQVTVVFNDNCGQDDDMLEHGSLGESSSGSDTTGDEGGSRSPEPGSSRKRQVKEMKVNLNKSVKEFKLQLSNIFSFPANQMRLFYVDHVMIELMGPEEMKFNQKKLYTYNVQDGDKFLVDPK